MDEEKSPWTEDPLPLVIEEASQGSGIEREKRSKPTPAAAFAACPGCTAGRVALEPHAGHYLWRQHYLKTWSGAAMLCGVTGSRLCEVAERPEPGAPAHQCLCKQATWNRVGS